jgi:serine protease Do
MRKFVVIAASLALAGAGVLAAGQDTAPKADPPKAKAETEQTKTRKKTVIVERDDQGGAPKVYSWDQNGDFDAPMVPGLMLPTGPRIGVTVANLDGEQAKAASGVVVTDVRESGPAAKAGVKEKDVITEFDGERVRSAKQLTRLVSETPEGRSAKLTVLRDGKRLDLQVAPEADERPMAFSGRRVVPGMPGDDSPHSFPRGRDRQFFFSTPEKGEHFEWKTPEPGSGGERFFFHAPGESGDGDGTFNLFVQPGRGRLGVGVQELSEQLAEYFGTKDGVLVTSVTKDSPAAKAGLRAGDVITTVDDTPVSTTGALIGAVQKAGDGATLKLGYVRDKQAGSATATLESREKPKVRREAKPI